MRSRVASIALLTGVAALAGTFSACASDETTTPSAQSVADETNPSTELPPNWTTYHDVQHGFTVSFPTRWRRAEESLTPHLDDPREILALGTFPLRPGGERCAQFPVNALEDLRAEDAFISVQERSGPPTVGFLARPAHFRLDLGSESEARECLAERPEFVDRLIPFTDGGRAFYAYVAIGDSASDETRRDVFGILDRLRFDERSGEGSQEAEPATGGERACVPHGGGHARICALAPPNRRVEGGSAYKVTTISGESFWVILPDELAPPAGVVAVPGIPVRVNAGLTTAPAREAADRYCDDFPECEPIIANREKLPAGGVLTRWDDASGTIKDLEVTTVDFGPWTLVMLHPDAALAERVAQAFSWTVDEDGYPRLASTDPGVPVDVDWADVFLWVPNPERQGEYHLIEVIPGCELSSKEPDLGGSDAGPELEYHEPDTVEGGRWCVDGRYWVDVAFAERPRLELFHERLRIVPSLG